MKNITIVTAISLLFFMSLGVTSPVNSLYAESLGASYFAIGLLGTVNSSTMILFSAIWGRASDQAGRRKPFLAAGLALLAAVHGLTALVPSYGYLFPLNVLGAIGGTAYNTSSLALMGDLLEHHAAQRGRRIGLYRGLGSLGFGVTAFLMGSVADALSIRVPYGISALILLTGFLLVLAVDEPAPSGRATRREEIWRLLPRSAYERLRALMGQFTALVGRRGKKPEVAGVFPPESDRPRLPLTPLLITAFLWSLVFGAVYAVWGNYMVSQHAYTRGEVSKLWSLAALSEFPLMILAGWVSDRIGRLPMLGIGLFTWAIVYAGYVFAPLMPWIVAVQLVRGFAYASYAATSLTYAAEVRPAQRGWVSGIYSAAAGVGSILGSFMGGTLAQYMGTQVMILASAALILGGAAYLAAAALRHRRGPTTESAA